MQSAAPLTYKLASPAAFPLTRRVASQVNKGLSKMFEAEVLYKFPVIQHFMFGTLLKVELPAGKPPAYIQK